MNKKTVTELLFKKIDYSKEDREIIEGIENAKMEMEVARAAFDYAKDDKLIESLIYKEHDIQARYAYLLREAKKRGLKVGVEHIFKESKEII
ncbi:YaaL family protein [Clostridium tarantellae]|uniref:DUF2508 family protein n=1 Tax=Clostridium tarantellae TaxID=39493 RepID=A0A6I1MM00_9CLOT|nr:YaaL family protein [Clostridium tarantellae]MPQ44516.1 DUF2508 family protein [Clostridium tarantellae]